MLAIRCPKCQKINHIRYPNDTLICSDCGSEVIVDVKLKEEYKDEDESDLDMVGQIFVDENDEIVMVYDEDKIPNEEDEITVPEKDNVIQEPRYIERGRLPNT